MEDGIVIPTYTQTYSPKSFGSRRKPDLFQYSDLLPCPLSHLQLLPRHSEVLQSLVNTAGPQKIGRLTTANDCMLLDISWFEVWVRSRLTDEQQRGRKIDRLDDLWNCCSCSCPGLTRNHLCREQVQQVPLKENFNDYDSNISNRLPLFHLPLKRAPRSAIQSSSSLGGGRRVFWRRLEISPHASSSRYLPNSGTKSRRSLKETNEPFWA